VLSKEDLWNALTEYPEAKQKLIEKGRQMLRKDNLLDEELAKQQDLLELTAEQKLERLEKCLDETTQQLRSMMENFNTLQLELKKRITKAEKRLRNELFLGGFDDDLLII